jgi:hypothetical protein
MKQETIYINVCNPKTNSMVNYDYDRITWKEINNEPELIRFKNSEISNCVCDYFKKNKNELFISAAVLVQRYIKGLNTKLSETITSQNHNSFTIIIDNNDAIIDNTDAVDTISTIEINDISDIDDGKETLLNLG